jgi:hypothetical protein
MVVTTGSPRNTFATMPSREIGLLLDPACIPYSSYAHVIRLICDLRSIEPPITIQLLVPCELLDQATAALARDLHNPFLLRKDISRSPFKLDTRIPSGVREPLLKNSVEVNLCLGLLSVAEAVQADGIITNDELLINARYPLYQYHRIRVIPLRELDDTVEVFAHGHSVFWSSTNEDRYMIFDLFYQRFHWKGSRFARWFLKVAEKIASNELRESLRSALLNRYAFILYCRDMIRFYELQADFFKRRGQERRFFMGVGFYVSTFYLFLWGMLEHLTIIAKWAKNLKVDERNCGIRSKQFWTEFNKTDSRLNTFLNQPRIKEWISVMAEMRHAAAHRDLALPTEILEATEESEKSDEEILEIIKKERSYMYESFLAPIVKAMEPMMIRLWRIKKMREGAPSAVIIEIDGVKHIRDPVLSVDYDLQHLTAVMAGCLPSGTFQPASCEWRE